MIELWAILFIPDGINLKAVDSRQAFDARVHLLAVAQGMQGTALYI